MVSGVSSHQWALQLDSLSQLLWRAEAWELCMEEEAGWSLPEALGKHNK